MKLAAIILLSSWTMLAQQPGPSVEEQQDLMRAVNEGTSPVDLIRGLEAHLAKYPNSSQRLDIERSLAKAAIEDNDVPRIAKYGESAVATSSADFQLLDRLAYAFLTLGGEENAAKAYKYARAFEDLVDKMPVATGRDAAHQQDEQERAMGRALMYQARARTIEKDTPDALRLAARAFSAYPGEETAREWAEVLLRGGQPADAIEHLAEAFVIPDPHATDEQRQGDRLLLGELYAKVHGSEMGLGDLVLSTYDRVSTIVESRRKKLLALEPNSSLANPMEFTVTGLDGKKLQLASLKGKLLILDFWATWCVPCRVQHPLYETLRERFGSRGDVAFLEMNADEDHSVVEPFLTAEMWDKTVYFEDGLARLLNVMNIPTTILIDKSGSIVSRMDGFDPSTFLDQMTSRIQAIIDAK
ncbi:MAG TPA: TlpA disulfide reductase family protein [Bryobacteraceae bacterium]|jgi:thiol-disulfide isomerase/thioredoxin|nr:TlpA disulfide reductase family protein [Bryobacteraceae bacterium]